MKPRPCEWCVGAGRKHGHVCPKCEGSGSVSYHYCFSHDEPDAVSPATVERMRHDPTYQEIVDGPVLEQRERLLRAVDDQKEHARIEGQRVRRLGT